MVSLLDVNVLMALGWSNHEHHAAAHAWLGSQGSWATCALTETAFVRLSSNPAVVGGVIAPHQAAIGLEKMTAHLGHVFLGSCA